MPASFFGPGLAEMILPLYSDLAGLNLKMNLFGNPLLAIAIVSVGYQAVTAALSNPVDAIRHE